MKLLKKQIIFSQNIIALLRWIFENGYTVTFGEAWRPEEMQKIYYDTGRTKTMNSQHMKRLAIDLNIFINNILTYDKEDIQPIGDYWKSLNKNNRWGGDWEFCDTNHFEMKE